VCLCVRVCLCVFVCVCVRVCVCVCVRVSTVIPLQRGMVEKFHLAQGADSSVEYDVAIGTFASLVRQGGHVREGVYEGQSGAGGVSVRCGRRE